MVLALATLTFELAGCTEQDVVQGLRALQDSGDVSFVCRGADGRGYAFDTCPEEHQTVALVTQVSTGEIASIDVETGGIFDVDPTIPGYTFLRVGGRPLDIVSTPGGIATFVGVGEVGREGIFAIPTSCLAAPREGETLRDLTSWPACSLPAQPGEMKVLVAPPDADGKILDRCQDGREQKKPIAADRDECAADLRDEVSPPGRRKLLVTLPALGQLALIDAQELLDREPGSFDPCPIEVLHNLEIELPTVNIEQPVPDDLQGNGCIPASIPYPPPTEPFQAHPGGSALSETQTLYVSDRGAPVIHVLDMMNPCRPVETPPLLPVSFHAQGRVVTTRGVSVSPLTREGKRFVYAIDERDQPSASLMAFDVSLGSTSRTPIIRAGATRLPFEPVDRIRFPASVKDIEIVKYDNFLSDDSGVSAGSELCDPDPNNDDPKSPGFRLRTSLDYTIGAGPRTLRGIFAFALLTDSNVSVIDIEDFDAPCRRPITANTASAQDFKGCAGDPELDDYFTLNQELDGPPTVSAEASCRVVQPHRPRSANHVVVSPFTGSNAPSLRNLPTLTIDQEDKTENPYDLPRLLAVDFPNPAAANDPKAEPLPAEVYVANKLLRRAVKGQRVPDNELLLAPRTATRFSLTLPLEEPRAYPPDETVSATYEGAFSGTLTTGFLRFENAAERVIEDFSGGYCSRGTEDVRLMRETGEQRFGLTGDALDRFAHEHTDYVQITSELRDPEDAYWDSAQGEACGGYNQCKRTFGTGGERELKAQRELRILEAYQDRLVVEPRGVDSEEDKAELMGGLACCFPGATAYTIRASQHWVVTGTRSGFRHRISPVPVAMPDGTVRYACARDCDPRRQHFQSRAFELSSSNCNPAAAKGEPGACFIGHDPDATFCTFRDDEEVNNEIVHGAAVKLPGTEGAEASECIFESLTARFAIYRGTLPSQRDMIFSWEMLGGFVGLDMNLALQLRSAAILPQSMVYVPELRRLAVVDGATTGLSLIGLGSLRVASPSPFF